MSRRRRATPTALDRVIGAISPTMGLRRLQARQALALVSGYEGGRRGRRATEEWRTAAASANADTLPDLEVLRARSRDLYRNDPLARSAINTPVTHVVGTGHVVRPEIDADMLGLTPEAKADWERRARAVWRDWAGSVDADLTRTQTFAELEDLGQRSVRLSGDVLVILRFRPRPGRLLATTLQMVEADRVSNPTGMRDGPRLAGGVELDDDGAPLAYHVSDRHMIDLGRTGGLNWTRVPAWAADGSRNVLHLHGVRERPDMTRYVPDLAPVIETLKQRSRYAEAELMAAVVNACFAIGLRTEEGDGSEGLETAAGATAALPIRITEPGQIFDLGPNEAVESFTPGRPSAAFEPFISALAQEVGAGVDLPHELLTKAFNASYSASRAAIEMAWATFRGARRRHVVQFCQPVYEAVIAEAVARRVLDAPGFFGDPLRRRAWLGATWMGPARPTIDPAKDATADRAYLDMGATTRTRIVAERFGEDWEAVEARLADEAARRLADGVATPVHAAASTPPANPEDSE